MSAQLRLAQAHSETRQRTQVFGTSIAGGGGGGDNGGMEARIAKLEATMAHIESSMVEIKADLREMKRDARTDFRLHFGALIASTLGLAGLMAKGFGWL